MSVRLIAAIAAVCVSTSGAFAQNAGKPTDPQIAHIAYTAGQIDIEAAQQALNKSQNKDVREFANDMERDHKAVNDKALALVKKLNVKSAGTIEYYCRFHPNMVGSIITVSE
jgi:putative membrane protein